MSVYTHIIVTCRTEDDTTKAFAFLSGGTVRFTAINGMRLVVNAPPGLLDNLSVRRVAPRILRLDKTGRSDIDFARIRQILTAQLRLTESFDFYSELEGLSS